MRSLLGFSLLLLLLAFLLFLEGRQPQKDVDTTSSLDLVVFSRGAMSPPVENPLTSRHGIHRGIIAGDLVLGRAGREPGLGVACFAPDLRFERYRNYALARSKKEVKAFLHDLDSQPENTVMVLYVAGSIRPGPKIPKNLVEALAEAFATLGAANPPHEGGSWCMITLKRPQGWVRLAESFSVRQGTTLAFQVTFPPEHYDDFRGDHVFSTEDPDAEISLVDELANAQYNPKLTRKLPDVKLAGVRLPAISMITPHGKDVKKGTANRVLWESVPLGARPGFKCRVGIRAPAMGKTDGVIFSVLVNGVVLEQREALLPKGVRADWQPLEVDLAAYAGETVDLELTVSPKKTTTADYAVWGEPILFWKGS